MRQLRLAAMVAALGIIAPVAAAIAQTMPKEQTWTAYDSGSAGFGVAAVIAEQFKSKLGTSVIIVQAGNDTGRLEPLKTNRALISSTGIGAYYAQEGVFDFAARGWGPQPVRLMMAASSCNGLSLAVAKDTGVQEVKDLKGKRIGIVRGAPALTRGALALIAFGGLTEADVTLVEFPDAGAMWQGIVENKADAGLSATISNQTRLLAESPRGIVWPWMVAADKEAWARVRKLAPYFGPVIATCGWGGLGKEPHVMAGYAFPSFMTYADRADDTIYAITKGMIGTYRFYKDLAPGADGMELDRQNFEWVMPYHDGAIRAFKDEDIWDEFEQKHNDALVARQKVLADAWKDYGANAPADDKAFREGWMKARAAALRKAGMEPVYE